MKIAIAIQEDEIKEIMKVIIIAIIRIIMLMVRGELERINLILKVNIIVGKIMIIIIDYSK